MHRSLVASAALAAVTCVASAQSSISIYGTVDVSGRYVKADGQPRLLSEQSGALNSGQLGFRGSEDLGDGTRVGFNLLSDVFANTGSTGAKLWNRTSTLSLSSRLGELRLGRDYTPTFLQLTLFDPQGYIGLGGGVNVRQLYAGTRQDNSLQYLLPGSLGGVFGGVMVTASENGTTADRPTRYVGGRLGFSKGQGTIVAAYADQRFAVPFAVGSNIVANAPTVLTTAPGDHQKTSNIAGSYDFGQVKLLGLYDHESLNGFSEKAMGLGVVVPMGAAEVHGGYDRTRLKHANGTTSSVDQLKLTYVYNLSKRTAAYATAAKLDNKDSTRLTLPGAAGPTVAGGKSQGAEFGIRHFF
jgi:predicted porin